LISKRIRSIFYYTSSYEDLLCKSKLPSLKVGRLRTFALEVFKIANKDCPVYVFDLIDIKNTSYSFRYQNKAAYSSWTKLKISTVDELN
jgi:hypothetical protein